MTEKLVNGKILEAARDKIKNAMAMKGLSKKEHLQYEILDLIVMYIAEDHPKTKEMYNFFRPVMWALVIMGGSFLTALAAGKIVLSVAR